MNGNGEVLEALRGMWGEMKTLNGRVNGTNERLDRGLAMLGTRIDETSRQLGARIDDVGTRIDETSRELGARIDETNRRLELGFGFLAGRIENLLVGGHGREHADLRERVARIEEHVGRTPTPERR